MYFIIKTILAVLLIYIVYGCYLFLYQRHIIFPYRLIKPPSVAPEIQEWEKIWIDTNFGTVEAWFLPPNRSHLERPAPAVIFAHGNAELIDFWPNELKRFQSLGIGVFLVEYPGYGRSEGKPSEKTVTETFIRAYDHLITFKSVDPLKIVFFGRSIGGGAVCSLARNRPCAAIILMSAFINIKVFSWNFLAPSFFILDKFDNLSLIGSYPGPVLIIHGNKDKIVPYEHGIKLYSKAKNGKMITYRCGHNNCPPDWELFWKDIESFLVKIGIIESKT